MKQAIINFKEKNRALIHDVFWRSSQIFFRKLLFFSLFFISARILLPYDFGVLNYALTIATLLITFCDFGISAATSKYTAEYKKKDSEKLKRIPFNSSLIIIAIASLTFFLLLIAGNFFFQDKYRAIIMATPMLLVIPLSSLFDGIYRGLQKFKKLSKLSIASIMLSAPISLFLVFQFNLQGAIFAQSIYYLIFFFLLLKYYGKIQLKYDPKIIKQISKYSVVIGLASVSYFLYSRVDVLILERYDLIVEIGQYEIANKVFNILVLPFMILGQTIAPEVAGYNARKNYSKILKKLRKFSILSIVSGVVVMIISYLFLPYLLKTFLSDYYSQDFQTAIFILLGLIPFKFWTHVTTQGFVIPSGNAKINTWITFIAGLFNIVLNIIFINILDSLVYF